MPTISPEWITAFSSFITTLTIIVLWRQFVADHERSRREKAIDMMSFWAKCVSDLPPNARITWNLIQKLDERQCECLWKLEPFSVEIKEKNLIIGALHFDGDPNIVIANDQINLNQSQVASLRQFTVNYLNLLEVVFSSWRHNIADRDIIRDEFGPLITSRRDLFQMDNLRIVTGVYPSIGEFTSYMKNEYKKSTGKKKIV